MSVKCKICQEEFDKLIPWRHLKIHNMSTAEYKKLYGKHSLASDEYRATQSMKNSGKNNPNFGNSMSQQSRNSIAAKNKGNIPHNKGKAMPVEQKDLLRQMAIDRNIQWHKDGTHPLIGRTQSNETKQKIRAKRKLQTILPESIQKALATKQEKGYDLAVFRGKKHSEESKQKISEASRKYAENKSNESLKLAIERLSAYGYVTVDINKKTLVLKCGQCGAEFVRSRQYASASKIDEFMCPRCFPKQYKTSQQEKTLANFIKQFVEIETNVRTLIGPKEIDIFIPQHNIAIEYNGLYWHSELHHHSTYHLEKSVAAEQQGIRLIHIFEDEWINHSDIVKSRILSLLGKSEKRVYGRKCIVKEIAANVANNFVRMNHLQGVGRSNVRLGLYYNDQLVSVMTFLHGDISKNVKGWELNRFCSLINYNVIGAAGKLFSYFINHFNPTHITSFSDKRWSNNHAVYNNLGFSKTHDSPPNYWYFLPNELHRIHRFALRKPKQSILSEAQLRHNEGYLRIYDCGSTKWEWSNEKGN